MFFQATKKLFFYRKRYGLTKNSKTSKIFQNPFLAGHNMA